MRYHTQAARIEVENLDSFVCSVSRPADHSIRLAKPPRQAAKATPEGPRSFLGDEGDHVVQGLDPRQRAARRRVLGRAVEDVAPCTSDVERQAYFVLDRREPLGYDAPDRRGLDTIWQLFLRHRQCPNVHP
jgi:hypothetical protein